MNVKKKLKLRDYITPRVLDKVRNDLEKEFVPPEFGIHKLFRHDAFLALFLLTFINAIIFIYYKVTLPQEKQSIAQAKEELLVFSKRVDSLSPLLNIINLHGRFSSNQTPEFATAITSLKIDQSEFKEVNGGLASLPLDQ